MHSTDYSLETFGRYRLTGLLHQNILDTLKCQGRYSLAAFLLALGKLSTSKDELDVVLVMVRPVFKRSPVSLCLFSF